MSGTLLPFLLYKSFFYACSLLSSHPPPSLPSLKVDRFHSKFNTKFNTPHVLPPLSPLCFFKRCPSTAVISGTYISHRNLSEPIFSWNQIPMCNLSCISTQIKTFNMKCDRKELNYRPCIGMWTLKKCPIELNPINK